MTENVNVPDSNISLEGETNDFEYETANAHQDRPDIATADRLFDEGKYKEAYEIYHIFGDEGDRHSKVRMGQMFASGLGVERLPLRAFNYLNDNVDDSDAESIFELGRCHFEGIGTPVNQDIGFEYIYTAATRGLMQAQHYIGMLNFKGDYVKKDRKKALSYFSDAASQGDAESQYMVACIYRSGSLKNGEKYHNALKKAAEMGFPNAMGEYGSMLIKEDSVPGNSEKGHELLKSAADRGDAEAARILGNYYFNGEFGGTREDAARYLKKALNGGRRKALFNLARTYSEPPFEDPDTAMKYFREGHEAGDLRCTGGYGALLMDGSGCEEDKVEAFKVFMKGARMGDTYCMGWVGDCYYNGWGVCLDRKKAFNWMETGARNGSGYCHYALARCYDDGRTVRPSKEMQEFHLRKAFDCGYIHAAYNLGWFFEEEEGKKSASESVYWYKRGAEAGDADCMLELAKNYESGAFIKGSDEKAFELYNRSYETERSSETAAEIGRCYENGIGTEQDIEKAIEWYQKASKRNGYSMWRLYEIYSERDGFRDRAIFWLRRSARSGLLKSMLELARMYDEGDGVPMSKKLAMEWYHRSAEEDSEFAKKRFEELMPEDPDDKEFDDEIEHLAFNIGEDNDLEGTVQMADLYMKGEKVEKDYVRARAWLEIGELFNVSEATDYLRELDKMEKGEKPETRYKQPLLTDFFEEAE